MVALENISVLAILMIEFGAVFQHVVYAQHDREEAKKTVDIAIVVDSCVLEWQGENVDKKRLVKCPPTSGSTSICDIGDWVSGIAKALCEWQDVENVAIALWNQVDQMSVLQDGRDPSTFEKKCRETIPMFVDVHQASRDTIMLTTVRRAFESEPNNRQTAPDIVVWIASYNKIDSGHSALVDWLRKNDGPDVVVGRYTYEAGQANNPVYLLTRERYNQPYVENIGDKATKKVAEHILSLLDLCTSMKTTGPCYFADSSRQKCHQKWTFEPDGNQNQEFEKYCRHGTDTVDCMWTITKCHSQCANAPRTWGSCKAPCGSIGTEEGKLEDTNFPYVHCPQIDRRACKSPQCTKGPPTGNATTTSKTGGEKDKKGMKKWHMIVIGVSGVVLLGSIICMIVCCMRKGKRKGGTRTDRGGRGGRGGGFTSGFTSRFFSSRAETGRGRQTTAYTYEPTTTTTGLTTTYRR